MLSVFDLWREGLVALSQFFAMHGHTAGDTVPWGFVLFSGVVLLFSR